MIGHREVRNACSCFMYINHIRAIQITCLRAWRNRFWTRKRAR